MKDFRPENFITFIKKVKLPFYYGWLMNICFIGMLLLFVTQSYAFNPNGLWVGVSLIAIIFLVGKLLIYGLLFRIYKMGRQVFEDIIHEPIDILYDVQIDIAGFDLFEVRNPFPPNFSTPIYDFETADILISGTSFFILGKKNSWGSMLHSPPVEITNRKLKSRYNGAKFLSFIETDQCFEIEIMDPNYKSPIRIRIKNKVENIRLWLQENSPNTEGHLTLN